MALKQKNPNTIRPTGKCPYLRMTRLLLIAGTQKNKANRPFLILLYEKFNQKRNDSLREDIEIEAIHHHPANTICDGCHDRMIEMGSTIVREEAKFIPAKMMKVQHIEHAYECKNAKAIHYKRAD